MPILSGSDDAGDGDYGSVSALALALAAHTVGTSGGKKSLRAFGRGITDAGPVEGGGGIPAGDAGCDQADRGERGGGDVSSGDDGEGAQGDGSAATRRGTRSWTKREGGFGAGGAGGGDAVYEWRVESEKDAEIDIYIDKAD